MPRRSSGRIGAEWLAARRFFPTPENPVENAGCCVKSSSALRGFVSEAPRKIVAQTVHVQGERGVFSASPGDFPVDGPDRRGRSTGAAGGFPSRELLTGQECALYMLYRPLRDSPSIRTAGAHFGIWSEGTRPSIRHRPDEQAAGGNHGKR